ncbi:MAG: GTPase ObgE [Lentisphaerae bacterium]|nr:GTPase ObgE [Lentisphaerota bacterium]
MFVDRVKISVKGGRGGNGCVSFHREKFVPRGGPDGGNGGNGGSVVLKADVNEQSLIDLSYNRHYDAPNGPNGKGKNMYGKNADNVVVKVPIGTVVYDEETGEFLGDLETAGMELVVAQGGKGGKGNAAFATSGNRAPRICEEGTEGEERLLLLELKTIADVGLVGYPNAGKSTLLRALSAAKPKVAPYPFTTLHPMVGVVEYEDFSRLTVADIPGLIDGAHRNVGLGHHFLRHIERTHLLVYVLDMAGIDGRTPWEDFRHLQSELELYMKGLSKRPALIAANKMDLAESAENLALLREELASEVIDIVPISADKCELDNLKALLREKVGSIQKSSPFFVGAKHTGGVDLVSVDNSDDDIDLAELGIELDGNSSDF